jgi:hypothetical protein
MSQAPPIQPVAPENEASPSLAGRLLNIFAAPGEVFDSIKNTAVAHSNWVAPAMILLVVGWIGGALVFSQESVKQQIRDTSERAIEKQIAKQHMPEAQAEQVRQAAGKYSTIGPIIGAAMVPIFTAFATPFLAGFFLWLIAKYALKSTLPYMKAVEVVGLAAMISVLEAIVRTLVIILTGNMYASFSPFLLIKDFNPENTLHSLVAFANPLIFWLLCVRAIGIAKVTGSSVTKAACWVFGVWLAYSGFFWALGWGARQLGKMAGG